MKNFTLAIAALAAVTLVSSTSFAATPFCGTSDHYNSRNDSRYDHKARIYNRKYQSSVYNSRNYLNNNLNNNYRSSNYLNNSDRATRPYNSLTNKLNSLYSNSWSKPLFTDSSYRARTSRNTFPTNSNRYNTSYYDRYGHDRFDHNYNWRYNR